MSRYFSLLIGLVIAFSSCDNKHNQEALDAYFKSSPMHYNRKLTDVIVSDIFTPPVASRIYAYANIAAYEGIRYEDSLNLSLAGQLNGLENVPKPEQGKTYYYPLVSMVAFTDVAQSLVLNSVTRFCTSRHIYSNSFHVTIA